MSDFTPFWSMILIGLMVLVWGLALGSFTTCVVYRIPRKLSLWRSADGSHRSFCPNCKAELKAKDLVPVFSYLWQRGKCRYCGIAIPSRYLWIELAVLGIVTAFYLLFGLNHWFFMASILVPVIAGFVSFLLFRPGL
jgi:leader peptidase (prepilin peptidase)/N-methyltransferase